MYIYVKKRRDLGLLLALAYRLSLLLVYRTWRQTSNFRFRLLLYLTPWLNREAGENGSWMSGWMSGVEGEERAGRPVLESSLNHGVF